MTADQGFSAGAAEVSLLVFYLGKTACAIDVRLVQEVNRRLEVTRVPLAPEFVRGVANLRGQIVMFVDLARKLGIDALEDGERQKAIIVQLENEWLGLSVDQVGDVMRVGPEMTEGPPANIGSAHGRYFSAIVKTRDQLIGVLNVAEALNF